MSDQISVIIGVRKEIGEKGGDVLVLTDPAGMEYGCDDAGELWEDIMSILARDDLPDAEASTEPAIQRNGPVSQTDVTEVLGSQVDKMVTGRYGDLAGRGAGEVARRLAPTAIGLLQRLSSRTNRFNRE